MGEPLFKVLQPGFLTMVQDTGRFTYQKYGYTETGAMDNFALRVGNRLVGNKENESGLEMTYAGEMFLAQRDCIIAVTGGDFSPKINGINMPMWQSLFVKKGSTISLPTVRYGARAYLCVQGGIDVPVVLGSKSTDLKCSFGGFLGRKLKAGDLIYGFAGKLILQHCHQYFSSREIFEHYHWEQSPSVIRITLGSDRDHFTDEGYRTLLSNPYTISEKMDRQGYQLSGPRIEHSHKGPNIITNFTPVGAVQVPGMGTPIILMKDKQTSGGYAKIANVITPDISKLAQKCSGDTITFVHVDIDLADELYKEYEHRISKTKLGSVRNPLTLIVTVGENKYVVNIGEIKNYDK